MMVETSSIISPVALGLLIGQAYTQVTTEEGPNLGRRRLLAWEWLGEWLRYCEGLSQGGGKYEKTDRVAELGRLKAEGLVFMATGEGGPAHRNVWDHMKKHVGYPVVAFEQEGYFLRHKDRRRPFLPLEVRISMAAHYGMGAILVPNKPDALNENDHHDSVFKMSGAKYCFATLGYPHEQFQRRRGTWAEFTGVPIVRTASTSLRTERLIEEDDYPTFLTMIVRLADRWESPARR